jgi:hypothetical protein
MAVWSVVKRSELPESFRLDAEYYRPDYLLFQQVTKSGAPLSALVQRIMHPIEIIRVYADSGVRILLAQNIRANFLDLSAEAYMPRAVQGAIARNRLVVGDVVMTRSGANFGDTACYLGDPAEMFACADCLIIRPRDIQAGYLSTFLNTSIGRGLLTRGAYGMAQLHIAPTYLKTLRIPRIGELETAVHQTVEAATAKRRDAKELYAVAESTLNDALGLADLDLTTRLFYEARHADTLAVARLDAEYFTPRMQHLIAGLARDRRTIADVATLAKRHFKPKPGQPFDYIEIADVTVSGTVESKSIPAEEAPSRAQWVVKPGDIITSTVRPIRRLSALIQPEQSGFVCSSGFAVLQPKDIEPEVLLTYLRLPLVCELLDLHTTASMYPAISTSDILRIPVSLPDKKTRQAIAEKVRESFAARKRAQAMLNTARRAVEIAIDESEAGALRLLKEERG